MLKFHNSSRSDNRKDMLFGHRERKLIKFSLKMMAGISEKRFILPAFELLPILV